jgi:hypothetical protein
MRIRQTLKPGQRGTQKLLARFGDRLVAVRYRYDAATRRRLKTVEIIVDEADWNPRPPRQPEATMVEVRIAWSEADLREQVKQAGGRWNPEKRVWRLPYRRALALGLRQRIVGV